VNSDENHDAKSSEGAVDTLQRNWRTLVDPLIEPRRLQRSSRLWRRGSVRRL